SQRLRKTEGSRLLGRASSSQIRYSVSHAQEASRLGIGPLAELRHDGKQFHRGELRQVGIRVRVPRLHIRLRPLGVGRGFGPHYAFVVHLQRRAPSSLHRKALSLKSATLHPCEQGTRLSRPTLPGAIEEKGGDESAPALW